MHMIPNTYIQDRIFKRLSRLPKVTDRTAGEFMVTHADEGATQK